MDETTKEITSLKVTEKPGSHIAGAIVLVKDLKAIKRLGKDIGEYSRECYQVEDVLTVYAQDSSLEEKFGVYATERTSLLKTLLPSSNPSSLHPSFEGKGLREILDFYIDNKNVVINEKIHVQSEILKVGYVPDDDPCPDNLSTSGDPEYSGNQKYLSLKQYVKNGKPKIILEKIVRFRTFL